MIVKVDTDDEYEFARDMQVSQSLTLLLLKCLFVCGTVLTEIGLCLFLEFILCDPIAGTGIANSILYQPRSKQRSNPDRGSNSNSDDARYP